MSLGIERAREQKDHGIAQAVRAIDEIRAENTKLIGVADRYRQERDAEWNKARRRQREDRNQIKVDIRVIGRSARAFAAAMYAHHDIDGPAEMAVALGKQAAWQEEQRKANAEQVKTLLEWLEKKS